MKAFMIGGYNPGTLLSATVPAPAAPGANQVQLALIGTSINPIDAMVARGYGAPLFNRRGHFPVMLGRDAVARVVAVGQGITDIQTGQRVLVAASPRIGGTYADLFNLPRHCVAPIGPELSDTTAAGLGYAGLTALQALTAANLSADTARGKQVCINGASGGVGSVAVILALRWGATVTAVASGQNRAWLQRLGAHQIVDYRDPAAMADIAADIIVNCATPADDDRQRDPLMEILQRRTSPGRAYVTTSNPVLGAVTEHGVVRGLATSGKTYLKKRLAARRHGIRYRWVLFKENPQQLEYLASLFAHPGTANIVGACHGFTALPEVFNDSAAARTPGKTVFLTSRS
ncbi:alcohol dehydrogenase catalytic domain-containing protein [Alcanivorax sp. JB21]|uniref:alcohol dehydrogenase catalytic domain-containing protein n=1 Tax=Alcanivorax limicola TaxID=2874102 RepID=UPI001CBC05C8|nr:alcohol dehydrogenase catalytic domain-containing protein [Alcanivorax limicola]MBZ2188279.1 alcohol dehydrogenase catalytic domain-containing protein [Alcanivorax limicola]